MAAQDAPKKIINILNCVWYTINSQEKSKQHLPSCGTQRHSFQATVSISKVVHFTIEWKWVVFFSVETKSSEKKATTSVVHD